ncbi:MAG: hypothetical protein KC910_07055 [Candidatus Eremiobacteraeota bacterium]|nr:hypothetical protein [Candidatus Eremiobacteraeota bacterium]
MIISTHSPKHRYCAPRRADVRPEPQPQDTFTPSSRPVVMATPVLTMFGAAGLGIYHSSWGLGLVGAAGGACLGVALDHAFNKWMAS